MKSRALAALAPLAAIALAACATTQPLVVQFPSGNAKTVVHYPKGEGGPQPQSKNKHANSPNQPLHINVPEYNLPQHAGSALENPISTTAQAKALVAESTPAYQVHPQATDYHGGAVVYPYVPNQVYQLFVAPLELTDIELEPGETITSAPAAGDTADFILATTYSVENGQKREQVLVKPLYAGKDTTLDIPTDRRTYTFKVYSYSSTYMPLVSFTYPIEEAQKQTQAAIEAQSQVAVGGPLAQLDFNYRIIPHTLNLPAWAPSIVFTDGTKTYIDFPSAERAAYAPVLFSVDGKGKLTLVNYHVRGTFYIVDRVLTHAELALNTNEGNVITIVKTD